ncbi:MAG: hypothetical protein JWR42_2749 [Marmoricola sp.]|nr:hypothetical protein [Marmoricola sp.]
MLRRPQVEWCGSTARGRRGTLAAVSTPFHPRCGAPADLVTPVPLDPAGVVGPTPGQARGPAWRRSSRGLYVLAGVEQTPEQRVLEQAQRLPEGGAVGGWAALRLHGARYFDGTDVAGSQRPVPLVVPGQRGLRGGREAVRVRTGATPVVVVERHGVPCLTAAHALVDEAAGAIDLRAAVTVLDMGLSAGVTTLPEVHARLETRSGARGVAQVRRALALADDRVLSPKETWLRLLWVLDAGLPRPRCNWPVADLTGRRLGRPDILCQELAVLGEYDGSEHRTRARHGEDVERDERYREVGLEVFTVVAADLTRPRRVVERMHAAVARARSAARPCGWMLASRPPRV